jgi:hypothetical protein
MHLRSDTAVMPRSAWIKPHDSPGTLNRVRHNAGLDPCIAAVQNSSLYVLHELKEQIIVSHEPFRVVLLLSTDG